MTIRKRLSRTNTRILLFALLSLLVIGVFIIEIFENLFRAGDQLCKITGSFRRTADFWMNINFRRIDRNTRKKDPSYGHNFYIAKDRQRVIRIFLQNSFREMQYLDSCVTINEPADVFVWRTGNDDL